MEIILISIFGALIIALFATKFSKDGRSNDKTSVEPPPADCCGAHEVCEKLSLETVNPDEIIYFNDEELDQYRDKDPATYTPEETLQFREILITMHPHEVSDWLKSLRARHVKLPPEVREEAINILRKQRA
ncbi:hypothetical protein ACT29H_02680 [Thermophagus sp. OGC60D27]|uniref:hypothetical protein n=1 Tax=Thermophagus sp. OGC60D27 TaxID=3458415 RepID=UPI0040380EB2